jgi:hypothetical protein
MDLLMLHEKKRSYNSRTIGLAESLECLHELKLIINLKIQHTLK